MRWSSTDDNNPSDYTLSCPSFPVVSVQTGHGSFKYLTGSIIFSVTDNRGGPDYYRAVMGTTNEHVNGLIGN